jgi:hypothetical protein
MSIFKAIHHMRACTDCLVFVANGDVPEDENGNEWSPDHIEAIWPASQYDLVCGDLDDDSDFSWQPCECCGSRLGGSRHALAALERK